MKHCNTCDTIKDLEEFSFRSASKDGRKARCKVCDKRLMKERKRSVAGLLTEIYSNMRSNSKARCHEYPPFTKQEFHDWAVQQPEFIELYNRWSKKYMYMKLEIPSPDRIDESIGYKFSNIQWMTWKENRDKEHNKNRSNEDLPF